MTAIGSAAIVRPGTDVTIATTMVGVHHTLEAGNLLAERGIDAEVLDLRTLRPP